MPIFDITFLRVDRDKDPTVMEAMYLIVDWPVMPREGESLEIAKDLDALEVESVGFGIDGKPSIYAGRVVVDDLRVERLRRAGRLVTPFPGGPTR